MQRHHKRFVVQPVYSSMVCDIYHTLESGKLLIKTGEVNVMQGRKGEENTRRNTLDENIFSQDKCLWRNKMSFERFTKNTSQQTTFYLIPWTKDIEWKKVSRKIKLIMRLFEQPE